MHLIAIFIFKCSFIILASQIIEQKVLKSETGIYLLDILTGTNAQYITYATQWYYSIILMKEGNRSSRKIFQFVFFLIKD